MSTITQLPSYQEVKAQPTYLSSSTTPLQAIELLRTAVKHNLFVKKEDEER